MPCEMPHTNISPQAPNPPSGQREMHAAHNNAAPNGTHQYHPTPGNVNQTQKN